VLLACQGQLRLAPSGYVVGIDMDASLRLAAARGHDLAVLSELLPAAEAGVVEALSTDRAWGNGPCSAAANVALLRDSGRSDAQPSLPSLPPAISGWIARSGSVVRKTSLW